MVQFSALDHNNIAHQCQPANAKKMTLVVGNSYWGISRPFGNMMQAVQKKSPLSISIKYMKYITLAGQMNDTISFYFINPSQQHSS